MNIDTKKKQIEHNGIFECPECGESNVSTIEHDHSFIYGKDANSVELTIKIPVRKCGDCDFCFTDSEADALIHEEICKHLKVMKPNQIKSLRELHGLSQAHFSKLTRLGEATISRWERGAVIQNGAYDNYLFLLGFAENIEKIERYNKNISTEEFLGKQNKDPEWRVLNVTSKLRQLEAEFKISG